MPLTTSLLLEGLVVEMTDATSALRESGEFINLAPLRGLERWCSRGLKAANDNRERYILWLLSTFVDDLFYNLAADFRYDPEIDELRQEYFRSLPDVLEKLCKSFEAEPPAQFANASQELVGAYLAAVEKISQAEAATREESITVE